MRPTQRDKAGAFRALHEGDPFLIPNPWDAGSAKVFEALGFKALATTSGGFAFTLGRLDGAVSLGEVAAHTRALDQASSLPLAVDLESGFGSSPEAAALAITRAAEAGADVLYAPGLISGDEIKAVTEAVAKPVNVLALPGLTMSEITEAGAQRVSVGSQLAWVAAGAMARAAEEIRDTGEFTSFAARVPIKEWLGG